MPERVGFKVLVALLVVLTVAGALWFAGLRSRDEPMMPSGSGIEWKPSDDRPPDAGQGQPAGPGTTSAAGGGGAGADLTRGPGHGSQDSAAKPASPYGVISGRVTDDEGLPVESMTVEIYQARTRNMRSLDTVRTGKDGRFSFDVPSAGKYWLTATNPESDEIYEKEVLLSPGETLRIVDLCIEGIGQGARRTECRVFGRVTRAGEPVNGEWVTFTEYRGGLDEEVETGDDGSYEMARIPSGRYVVSIGPARFAVNIPGTAQFRQDFVLTQTSAEGHVYFSATKKPVEGARVFCRWVHPWSEEESGLECRTDAKGRFEFTGISGGTYEFQAIFEDCLPTEKSDVDITENRSNPDIDLFLSRGGTLVGIVLNPEGKRLANLEVFLAYRYGNSEDYATNEETLDGNGEFRQGHLNPGIADIRLYTSGFAPARVTGVRIPDGGEVKVEFRLARGGTVKINVTDHAGKPVEGARFRLKYEDGGLVSIGEGLEAAADEFETDGRGNVAIKRVPPGPIVVALQDENGDDSRTSSAVVIVEDGEVVEKKFVIK